MDTRNWLDVIKSHKVIEEKYLKKEIALTIVHKVSKPIVLLFSSDWHIGSPYTDHEMLFRDIEEITSYSSEDVRLILAGDLTDNFPQSFKSAEAPANCFIQPELQKELLKEILDVIVGYIDLSTWGNHDVEFDERKVGYSEVASILKKRVPFFHGKGFIVYQIGQQKYRMLISHHLKGSSVYHDLQGPIRAWLETHSDIIVGGHHHSPSYLTDYRGQDERGITGQRVLMKLGTYKIGRDTFSDRYFKSGITGNNVLIAFPDRKKLIPFMEFSDAVQYLGLKKLPKKIKPVEIISSKELSSKNKKSSKKSK